MAYCAIYGLFDSGKAIAPEPPTANSVEAVTVILLSSAVVHATSALLIEASNIRNIAFEIIDLSDYDETLALPPASMPAPPA